MCIKSALVIVSRVHSAAKDLVIRSLDKKVANKVCLSSIILLAPLRVAFDLGAPGKVSFPHL